MEDYYKSYEYFPKLLEKSLTDLSREMCLMWYNNRVEFIPYNKVFITTPPSADLRTFGRIRPEWYKDRRMVRRLKKFK